MGEVKLPSRGTSQSAANETSALMTRRTAMARARKAVGRLRHEIEGRRQVARERLAGLGQHDAAPGASEQRCAKPGLELADVAADGGMA